MLDSPPRSTHQHEACDDRGAYHPLCLGYNVMHTDALALVDDPLFSEHRARGPHPERPERLQAARAAVAAAEISLTRRALAPRDATDDELNRVHSARYLEQLGRAVGQQGHFDADTFYGPHSVAAARRAAGGAISIVEALRERAAIFGVALLRPPGHHARPDGAMGFCMLNNVAVAAAHARANGCRRVAIVDWDVHHGNGTQDMFYEDPSVLYCSLHQFPFYPGTGRADEVGAGEGRGFTVNVPLSEGADDGIYVSALERLICPILNQYDPDLVLISAGFDAHRLDPLGSMRLTDRGYAAMLERLMKALPRGAEGRFALILEGGYDLEGLGRSLQASVETLDSTRAGARGVANGPAARNASPLHEREIGRAVAAHSQFWRLD